MQDANCKVFVLHVLEDLAFHGVRIGSLLCEVFQCGFALCGKRWHSGKERGKLCWESKRGLDVNSLGAKACPISRGWFVLDRVELTFGVVEEDRKSLLDACGNKGSQIILET